MRAGLRQAVAAVAVGSCLAAALLAASSASAANGPAAERQLPSVDELLARSIALHDPDSVWGDGVFRVRLESVRPGAEPARTSIVIDNAAGRFLYERHRDGHRIEAAVTGAECWPLVDGAEPTAAQIERFDLSCERLRRIRDYHVYLYGLPMKLRDPGTRIAPRVVATEFLGRAVWRLRVTYDPEVGRDTWYFFFDPATATLLGARFYHDESANDGETIVLEGMAEGGGLRLPKVRTWYRNDDDALLGTDTILGIERLSRDR